MELAADITYLADKGSLYVHVDVLEFTLELELAGLNLKLDSRQALSDRPSFFLRDDALLPQHHHVSNAARDVIGVESPVERNRRGVPVRRLVSRLPEPAANLSHPSALACPMDALERGYDLLRTWSGV